MAPEINRWRDIVPNPCNRVVQDRNTAAIRDALQALAEAQEEADETPSTSGGDTLIFFEVQETDVGAASVAVKEMEHDGGTWSATGADYTAYDWSPSQSFRTNFVQGYYGIGRLASAVASDALEVLSIEGRARFLQGTLDENMGATTTKQGRVNVTDYWGDIPNGRDPGTPIIVHDEINMSPNSKLGDKILAVWDETRQRYVLIAPWNGNQTPGQAAIVQVDGGDASLGCDDSVKASDFCLYRGRLQTVTVGGNFCEEKFTNGAPIWIVDGRNCHGTPRLGMAERYMAVSLGVNYDPYPATANSDERALYAVVDYSPAFRWFRILTDVEALTTEGISDDNDLKCRVHDCDGDQPDDAPSAWGQWRDIDPCTREIQTIDDKPVLVYFPRYRDRCKPAGELSGKEKCLTIESDPDCRKNDYILAWWNPIAERWDAVMDSEKCESKSDVAKITICDEILDPCCVYPGLRADYWPHEESYCNADTEHQDVWVICSNGNREMGKGYCEIGVKICDAFECTWYDGQGNTFKETRPVYMIHCGTCGACSCPPSESSIRFRIRVGDEQGACSFLHDIRGELRCLQEEPFVQFPGESYGWYGHFTVTGVTPRVVYTVYHEQYPDGVNLEIGLPGMPGVTAGVVLNAYAEPLNPLDPQEVAIPAPGYYTSGFVGCRLLTVADPENPTEPIIQYRAREYSYGLWVICTAGQTGLSNAKIYGLDPLFTTAPSNGAECGPVPFPVISSYDHVITGAKTIEVAPGDCCDGFQVAKLTNPFMSCLRTLDQSVEAVGDSISSCPHYGNFQIFGGCRCFWLNDSNVSSTCNPGEPGCTDGLPTIEAGSCCSHPDNEIYFEFSWPPGG